MKTLRINQLEKKVKKEKIVFAIFGTIWCGDCKVMMPFLLKLEKENPQINFYYLDAEKEKVFRDESNSYQILKVPTMILYVKGIEQTRGYEFVPYKKMQMWINEAKEKL